MDVLLQKGKGRATYYVPGRLFTEPFVLPKPDNLGEKPDNLGPKPDNLREKPDNLREKPDNLPGKPDNLGEKPDNLPGKPDNPIQEDLPIHLSEIIGRLGKRASLDAMEDAILQLCAWREFTVGQLAVVLKRNDKYLFGIITPLRERGKLEYTVPDMPHHPQQAYRTAK